MIFRRQLITAATAIITLTVLLASTDAAHIEDTVVPESTDSVSLVEEGNWYNELSRYANEWDYSQWQSAIHECNKYDVEIYTYATCDHSTGVCQQGADCPVIHEGKCSCLPGVAGNGHQVANAHQVAEGQEKVWCSNSRGVCTKH